MKYAREFITSTVVGGLFVVVPVYLAVLLLLKGMKSVGGLVRPIAALVPDWLPAEGLLSLILVLAICFLVGVVIRTPVGRAVRERMEIVFFERLPGYGLLRSRRRELEAKILSLGIEKARLEQQVLMAKIDALQASLDDAIATPVDAAAPPQGRK